MMGDMPTPRLRSPWLHQLARTRGVSAFSGNKSVDVAIIGGGIAGVTTAYFILKKTAQTVLLLEADRVAHGATGHNAGQLVSYFERPFTSIVEEFGMAAAKEGQREVDASWQLLDDIRHDLRLSTPLQTFTGYAGCIDAEAIFRHLNDNKQKRALGLTTEHLFIAKSSLPQSQLRSYSGLYTLVTHEEILDLLETKDRRYIAALAGKKGCMNSARFTEELVSVLLKKYPKRFRLAEKTLVKTVILENNQARLETPQLTVTAQQVVLCTNGFERIRLVNHGGVDIDTSFHHLIEGSIGYMAAFLEEPPSSPMAVSYLPPHEKNPKTAHAAAPYFYVTRRPYDIAESNMPKDLVCIGGPETLLDDTNAYVATHPYPDEAKKLIDDFLTRTYRKAGKKLSYEYLWHGLMGYTPNGIRRVGPEPCNPVLLYNLGCNGVGLLPSIAGSARIARIIKGDELKPSIFDPVDRRCPTPVAGSKKQIEQDHEGPLSLLHVVLFWIIIFTLCYAMLLL